MPVWGGLLALLGWNLSRHLRGLSTLCSFGRKYISALVFCAGWGALTGWLIPHFCRPRRR